jgi:hypothetical protein
LEEGAVAEEWITKAEMAERLGISVEQLDDELVDGPCGMMWGERELMVCLLGKYRRDDRNGNGEMGKWGNGHAEAQRREVDTGNGGLREGFQWQIGNCQLNVDQLERRSA